MSRQQRLKNMDRNIKDVTLEALSNLSDDEFVENAIQELNNMRAEMDNFIKSTRMTDQQAREFVFDV